jgi:hypothetical protein
MDDWGKRKGEDWYGLKRGRKKIGEGKHIVIICLCCYSVHYSGAISVRMSTRKMQAKYTVRIYDYISKEILCALKTWILELFTQRLISSEKTMR